MKLLDIRVGPDAQSLLQRRGLNCDDVDLIIGASGGPKWLVLAGLDSWLIDHFLPTRTRSTALPLLGSSIGSWRMACLASPQPRAARDRLLSAYIDQRYSVKPTPAEVSAECRRLLTTLVDEGGAADILNNPTRQLHVLVTAVHSALAAVGRHRLMVGLAVGGLRNLVSARWIGRHFKRVVFHSGTEPTELHAWRYHTTAYVRMTRDTLGEVLLASSSIPLLLAPVHLPEVSQQSLFDGGILDYHPLVDSARSSGLVLYPHFFPRLVPGWFDKALRWRHSPAAALRRTVLISPSAEWVATLPGGRIPDRTDFVQMTPSERQSRWCRIVAESARLGDAMHELVQGGEIAAHTRPFE